MKQRRRKNLRLFFIPFEWVIPNGGARENAGRKSKGYKMV